MNIRDIIFTIIAIACGVGAIIGTGLFCACAATMQKQEGEVKQP